MATTFVEYTGNGGATKNFTFPSYQSSDVKVRVDDVLKTASTHYNIINYTTTGGGDVVFTSGNIPSSGTIRIYRDTDVDTAKTTFTAGSSIRAEDLNNNQTQLLYRSQEEQVPNLIHSYDVDDSAITRAKIAADAIDGTKIADDSINSEHYVDGSIDTAHIADLQVTTAKIAADAVNGTKIADDSIDSEHYVDGSIDTAHIADSQVTTAKLANDAVTNDKLADNSVNTAQLIDSAVSTNKIADTAVTTAKIADDAVTADKLANSINATIAANTAKTSNVTHTGEVTGATALTIAADAVTGAKIADNAIDSEHYVDGSIDHVHLANDAVDGDNIADDSINSEHYVDGSIDTAHIADAQITTAKIADGAITDAKIAGGSLDNRYYTETELDAGQLDNRYYTETELNAGQLDNRYFTETELTNGALDGRYFTETEADARYFNISASETIKDGDTFPDNDTSIATTAAINDRIIDLVDDVGGFVPIANETSFPTANPDVNNGAGTIVSVKAASTGLTAQSGTTLTISNGAGSGNTVTITGLSVTIPSGFGFLVETTTTLHTYTFHRLVPKATEVSTVAGSISNINTVAGDISNVNAVAGNATNINTVAANNSNITSVAGNSSNINSAVSNASNINSAVSNATNINTVAGSISNVNTTAGSISNVNTVASNISDVNSFANVYRIGSSNPTTSLDVGDLFFNTTANELKVYNGSSWQGGVTATGSFATVTGNTFTGSNIHNDNVKSIYGTSSDGLEIFHNASNSVINDQGTGTLQLQTGGSTKLEVQSGGIEVTGNIVVSGTVDGVDIAALNTTVGNITTDVVSDTSPQLGGDLDVQAQQITTSTTNGNIKLTPNGTGVIEVKGAGGADGTLQLNCSANSHGVKIKSPPHSAAASYTLTLPDTDGSANQVLKTDGSGNLDWVNQTTDTNTQLSTEQVQDIAGPLVATGGTKTGITVTYDDANGNMDFVVASQTDENFTTADHAKLDGIEAGATADQTKSDIDALNINADQVDGIEAASFLRSDATDIKTAGHLTFNDSIKAKFGTSGDLEIYHDGNHSNIVDGGTGNLNIASNTTAITNAANNTNIAVFKESAEVELYHNGTKRIETDSAGVTVTGNIAVTGTVDGRDLATDGSKLDGIEASATADQTDAEIRAAVEAASDSNVFTDADHTKLNGIATSANNYSHPNHSGEVTSSGDGAMTIADNVVDEANLKISNSPQDGYMLTAQSGNTGGLTWAPAAAGATGASNDEIFWENGTNVTADYTITNGKNAGSFGPITIDSGVTVTVGSGETWTVV